jgi:hypothetical protein
MQMMQMKGLECLMKDLRKAHPCGFWDMTIKDEGEEQDIS